MKKINIFVLSVLMFVLTITVGGGKEVRAAHTSWNYITLSKYYILPTAGVTVYGAGYLANEVVRVVVDKSTQSVTTDSRGEFETVSFIIPYSVIGKTVTVRATGLESGYTSTARLKVGKYYPVVEPSSYYVSRGGLITFTGKDFAPDETVTIRNGLTVVGSIQTNSSGTFISNAIKLPTTSGRTTYTFTGEWSRATYSLKVLVY